MAEPQGGRPAKKGGSPFVMIAVFLFVLLIMFDNNLRLRAGEYVGFLMNPVASLWNYHLVWTLFFASVVMILATTAIRHFLVDWVQMARVQETMRTFQKEFGAARKNNNTYQLKRLTEMQPEIMQMQAEMSSGQLKPMAFTMLLVIPIFAWLSTITLAPVVYAAALSGGAAPVLLVAVGPDAQGAVLVDDEDAHLDLLHRSDLHLLQLPGASTTGTVTLTHPRTGDATTMRATGAEAVDWEAYRVGTLPPGTYRVQPDGEPRVGYTVDDDALATLSHVVVAIPTAGGAATAAFVNGNGATLEVAAPSDVYAFVPMAIGVSPTGSIHDIVRAEGSDAVVTTWDVSVETHLWSGDPAVREGVVTPHAAVLPWNPASDLNGVWWVLPHWILFYSLFSIPIGQITQKLLKLLEYSKVDLDADGKAPGLAE